MKQRLILCVTNDLHFDQRIHRIGRTLENLGFEVRLVGRRWPEKARPTIDFKYHRFRCWLKQGFGFYIEFNIRLFFYLLFTKNDVIVANDADTLLGAGWASILKRSSLVYDSHEWFTEVPELAGKPIKRKIWHYIQKAMIPATKLCTTVGPKLAVRLSNMYSKQFHSIRNLPYKKPAQSSSNERIMIYQGTLNEGRGLELAIDALYPLKNWKLWIAGVGPKRQSLFERAVKLGVQERVVFYEGVQPDVLHNLTSQATVGLNMLEKKSMNYYFSLANKFFDYVQAGIPSINMDFPEYRNHNEQFEASVLLENYTADELVKVIRRLEDPDLYALLAAKVNEAAEIWTWEKESKILENLYQRHVMPPS